MNPTSITGSAQVGVALRRSVLSIAGTAALALSVGVHAEADCAQPDMPEMPDGASATLEQMLEGQKSVKAFQTANMDYMKCLALLILRNFSRERTVSPLLSDLWGKAGTFAYTHTRDAGHNPVPYTRYPFSAG